jgi:hypothetical protein
MRCRADTLWLSLALALAGCGAHVDAGGDGAPGDDDGGSDADPTQPDGPPGIDAPLGAWTNIAAIGNGATAGLAEDDGAPWAASETELVFSGKLPNINKDIYLMTRGSVTEPWGPASAVTALNTTATEQTPRITNNGLAIYFASARGGGNGGDDIYTATRAAASPASPWTNLTNLDEVNDDADQRTFTPCSGNRYLMISFQTGNGDVYEGTLGVGPPVLVSALSDPQANETGTFITANCLEAWFASNRDDTTDIFYAHRDSVTSPWVLDGKVLELSTDAADESDPWVSADGHRMVFTSNADGENDLYTATR